MSGKAPRNSPPQTVTSEEDYDNFVDAKETWDSRGSPPRPKPVAAPISAPVRPRPPAAEELKARPPHQPGPPAHLFFSRGPASKFWSDPVRPENFKSSPQKSLIASSSFRGRAGTPFASKGASTNASEKDHTGARGQRPKIPEMFLTPDPRSGPALGMIPPQPLQTRPAPTPTPKPRTRVPPIAMVGTTVYKKEAQEFGNLALQQELRAGARPVWVRPEK